MGQADIVEPEGLCYVSNMLAAHHKEAREVFDELWKEAAQ
jgi:hypothetical protein